MYMILLMIGLIIATGVRLLRWLSIVQQKEYRWDRLRTYVASLDGLRELVRVIPRVRDFSRTGLKRPKVTGRIAIVLVLTLGILLCLVSMTAGWLEKQNDSTANNLMLKVFFWLGIYICIPIVVLIACIPTAMISFCKTIYCLLLAKGKIDQKKPLIIGITGSYGKTTTKQLLAHLLLSKQSVFVTPKSYNTRYSVAQSILQQYQSEAVAILEYGAYSKGEIANLAGWFKPSIALITGFAPQHLGLFGSREAIIEAKSELIAALPIDGVVMYNAIDEGVHSILKMGVKKWQVRHQRKEGLVVIACDALGSKRNFRYSLNDMGYVEVQLGRYHVTTHLVGLQHAQTIELATTAALYLGQTESEVLVALGSFIPSDNFMKISKTTSGSTLIDDGGTSNPVGFQAALAVLDHCVADRKVLITAGIVDLGKESSAIHKTLAIKSKTVVANVLFVGWSGRTEFQAVFGKKCQTDQGAILRMLKTLGAGDVVLVEGKMPGWVNQFLKQI